MNKKILLLTMISMFMFSVAFAIVDSHSLNLDQSTSQSANTRQGFHLQANYNINLKNVTKHSSDTSTTALLYDSSETLVDTQSFSGDIATFDYNFSKGEKFFILTTHSSSFTRRFSNIGSSLPENSTNIAWLNGSQVGTPFTYSNQGFSILSVGTEQIIPPGIITTNLTNGTYFNSENISIEVNTSINSDAMFYYLNNTNHIVEDGLVGYYNFDGDYTDASGNGNDGTNSGTVLNQAELTGTITGATFTNNSQVGNYAINFTGSSYITTSDTFNNPYETNTFWAKRSDCNAGDRTIFSYNDAYNQRIWFDFTQTQIKTRYTISGTSREYSVSNTCDTNWHFYATQFNGTHLNIWKDNSLIKSDSTYAGTISSTSSSLVIGRTGSFGGLYFNGTIDDFRRYERALTSAEIADIYANNSLANDVRQSNANRFNFEEGSGSTTAGQPIIPLDVQQVEFDGSSHITVSNLEVKNQFTVTSWIKNNGGYPTSNEGTFLGYRNEDWELQIENNNQVWVKSNQGQFSSGSDTAPIGEWTFVTLTSDATTTKLYINNILKSTQTYSLNQSGTDFYIGKRSDQALYYNGSMDEVRIYDRALTPTEIETLYNESPYNKICDDCNNSFVNLYDLQETNYNISFLAIADQTIATLEQNFNIDLTNPVITDTLPAEINSYFLNISNYVSCSDANLKTCNITFTPDGKTSPVTNESYEFTYNGNQSYNIIAEDQAGNVFNSSGVILVNPYQYFRFNDSLTGTLVQDFTLGGYQSNNTYVQIPVYDLGLGNQSLSFEAFGYNDQNFSFTLTNNSRINITYNVTPTTLNIKIFDAITSQQLTFNATVLNTTNTQTFLNQINMSKRYNETPTGDITIIINSQGYKEARYFNTLTNATSITIFGYLFQDNATDVEVVQFFTRETGTDKNLDGVLIEAQRIINGSLTTITQATTDDSGATFMWLDTSLTYSFIFSKAGYATSTANSIPGVNSYTVKMERDVDAREYIDGINIMFTPSLDRVSSNPNPNFRTFITGVSITSMTYELIDQNGTIVYTDTSTNPTGTTFNRTLNVSGYTELTQKITYIVDGATNIKQKTYKIISIDTQNFLEYMKTFNDTTDEGTNIFVWIVMFISIGGAFMVGSKIGQPSLFVIATSAFFTFTEWMPLPYFGVISFSAIIFWMAFGGTK